MNTVIDVILFAYGDARILRDFYVWRREDPAA